MEKYTGTCVDEGGHDLNKNEVNPSFGSTDRLKDLRKRINKLVFLECEADQKLKSIRQNIVKLSNLILKHSMEKIPVLSNKNFMKLKYEYINTHETGSNSREPAFVSNYTKNDDSVGQNLKKPSKNQK